LLSRSEDFLSLRWLKLPILTLEGRLELICLTLTAAIYLEASGFFFVQISLNSYSCLQARHPGLPSRTGSCCLGS
jgi:hypothetical protein